MLVRNLQSMGPASPFDYITVLQEASIFLPKQIAQVAQFFGQGLFAHYKLYNFLLTQPQAHTEHEVSLQVLSFLVQSP